MIASLPMYDLPCVTRATNAWWDGLARHFRAAGIPDVPASLTRGDEPLTDWRAPDLLLSQTCGYPLTHALADHSVRLVATPSYAAPGCEDTAYASVLVVSTDSEAETLADLSGGVAAINSHDSQSGCHVLRYMTAALTGGRPLFRAVEVSGAHVASIAAVAAGRADVAAVDAVTHALLTRHTPDVLTGTRCLSFSPRAPGLPYITRSDLPDEQMARLRAGLMAAIDDPTLAGTRQDLLIDGFDILTRSDYQAILDMEHHVERAGLPDWQ